MPIDPSAQIAPDVELAPDVAVGPGVIIDGPSQHRRRHPHPGPRLHRPLHHHRGEQPHRLRGHRRLRPPGLRLHRRGELHHHRRPQPHPGVRHHPPGHQAGQRHPGGQSQFSHGPEPHGPQLLPGESRRGGQRRPGGRLRRGGGPGLHFGQLSPAPVHPGGHPGDDAGRRPGLPGPAALRQYRRHPRRSRASTWWACSRAGFSVAQIAPLRQAFRLLFGRRTNLKQALEQVEAEVHPDPGSHPPAGIYPRLQTGRGHGPPAGPAGR